jgi:hypothetical protein
LRSYCSGMKRILRAASFIDKDVLAFKVRQAAPH